MNDNEHTTPLLGSFHITDAEGARLLIHKWPHEPTDATEYVLVLATTGNGDEVGLTLSQVTQLKAWLA